VASEVIKLKKQLYQKPPKRYYDPVTNSIKKDRPFTGDMLGHTNFVKNDTFDSLL
jgi:hypothetical protein